MELEERTIGYVLRAPLEGPCQEDLARFIGDQKPLSANVPAAKYLLYRSIPQGNIKSGLVIAAQSPYDVGNPLQYRPFKIGLQFSPQKIAHAFQFYHALADTLGIRREIWEQMRGYADLFGAAVQMDYELALQTIPRDPAGELGSNIPNDQRISRASRNYGQLSMLYAALNQECCQTGRPGVLSPLSDDDKELIKILSHVSDQQFQRYFGKYGINLRGLGNPE